jgi:hypothetical protein
MERANMVYSKLLHRGYDNTKLLQTIKKNYNKFQIILKEKYEITEIFKLKYTIPTFKNNTIVDNVLLTQINTSAGKGLINSLVDTGDIKKVQSIGS